MESLGTNGKDSTIQSGRESKVLIIGTDSLPEAAVCAVLLIASSHGFFYRSCLCLRT